MREQELKLEKVKKSCNTAKKVVGVFKVILIVTSVICFVAGAGIFAFRDKINTEISAGIEAGNGTFDMDDVDVNVGLLSYEFDSKEAIANGEYAEAMLSAIAAGFVVSLMFAVVFILIQKIFKIMDDEETPFSESVLKKMKRVFIALTIIIALEIGLGFGAVLGMVFWCIYNILDYGYALQKEVDEML